MLYRVLWILIALWIVLSQPINILRNLQQQKFGGCPQEFYHIFMYIAPSSDHSLLTPNLPFMYYNLHSQSWKFDFCQFSVKKKKKQKRIVKQWHHQLTNLHIHIHRMFSEKWQNFKMWNFLILCLIFIKLSPLCSYFFLLYLKSTRIGLNVDWI